MKPLLGLTRIDQPLIYIGGKSFYSYDLEKRSYREIVKSPCGSYPTQPWEQAVCSPNDDSEIPWDLVTDFIEANDLWLRDAVEDPQNQDNIYLATYGGVFLSSDRGKSWNVINDGFLNMHIIYDLAFDPQNPNDLYALTPYGIYELEAR